MIRKNGCKDCGRLNKWSDNKKNKPLENKDILFRVFGKHIYKGTFSKELAKFYLEDGVDFYNKNDIDAWVYLDDVLPTEDIS